MATQMTAQQAAASNLASRNALLSSATRQNQQLQSFTSPGSAFQIQINNTGIVTSFDVMFTVVINNTGTTTVTAQEGFPYTLLNNIKFTDYTSTDRVNISGRMLANVQSIRHAKIWQASYTLNQGDFIKNSLGYPADVSGATIPAGGSMTATFYMRIPLAYEPNSDLRGALVAQSYTGQAWLKFAPETSNLAGNPDSPFTAGSGSNVVNISSFTAAPVQNFLQPQSYVNGLPVQDLSTIYELNSWTQNTNLAVNQDTFINYPNSRIIVAAHFLYYNGAAFTYGTDMSVHQTVVSGNTILTNTPPTLDFLKLREHLMADPHQGYYYSNHRAVPLSSYLYGTIQEKFRPTVVGATAYFTTVTESFYTSGSALPGVSTQ